jgi:hypothetical protein
MIVDRLQEAERDLLTAKARLMGIDCDNIEHMIDKVILALAVQVLLVMARDGDKK